MKVCCGELDEKWGIHTDDVMARSAFCTVRGSACVYGGQWMWECTVLSEGMLQIGWTMIHCGFNKVSRSFVNLLHSLGRIGRTRYRAWGSAGEAYRSRDCEENNLLFIYVKRRFTHVMHISVKSYLPY